LNSLFTELKRRNIFRVAGVYAVIGWLIMQVISVMTPALNLPDWVDSFFAVALIAGFPVAILLAWAFELTPEGMKPTKAVTKDDSISTKTGRKLDYAIIGGLALVGGLLVFQTFRTAPTKPGVEASQITEASIAVLPFADLSSDNSQEYFGDGIAEELLNVLAKIKEMKVAGRTSSFAFKGQNQDLREIGRVLNVAHILEGSIRKSGDRVRVTAQLIKVDDGFHLWSETYDRDLSDIFAVQDEISHEISQALMPHLIGDQAPDIQEATRTDVTAYSKFLQARDLVRLRNTTGIAQAQVLLNDVLETDPAYAPAYALQAEVTLHLSNAVGAYGTVPIAEALPASMALIDKALSIDPLLGHGYAARGLAYSIAGESDKSITALNRAVELSPNNLDANMWLAFELIANRRYRDNSDALSRIFDKDPLYGPIPGNLLNAFWRTGQIESGPEVVERLENIAPDTNATKRAKARLIAYQGQDGNAANALKGIYEETPNARDGSIIAEIFLRLGHFEEFARYDNSPFNDFWASIIKGDGDAALAKIETVLEQNPESGFVRNEYILGLSAAKDYIGLVTYFDETWGTVQAFEEDVFSPYGGAGPRYPELAEAFQITGDQQNFDAVMERWRVSLDLNKAGGHEKLHESEALWQMLSSNPEEAISVLKAGFDEGPFFPSWVLIDPLYDPLKGNPRFEALKEKNLARINEERAVLGIPPFEL